MRSDEKLNNDTQTEYIATKLNIHGIKKMLKHDYIHVLNNSRLF